MGSPIQHLILDRDGVLNVELSNGYCLTQPDQFEWLPGALSGLRLVSQMGILISVATNQSAIGRGLMTASDLDTIHRRMCDEARCAGATIAAVRYCPHAPDANCACRKPNAAMI